MCLVFCPRFDEILTCRSAEINPNHANARIYLDTVLKRLGDARALAKEQAKPQAAATDAQAGESVRSDQAGASGRNDIGPDSATANVQANGTDGNALATDMSLQKALQIVAEHRKKKRNKSPKEKDSKRKKRHKDKK